MKKNQKSPFLLLFFLCILQWGFSQTIGKIEKVPCFLEDCSGLENPQAVEFGYLYVPEDYDKPEVRILKIAFALIKASEKPVAPDPVIVFQGGWGMPILNTVGGYQKNYPIKNRDIILFDYRGTGYSSPKLCDWIGEAAWEDLTKDLSHKSFQKNQTLRFNQCLDSLELRGIDYNQYGSNTKTKDAVLLAETLGYSSYNLAGISYGTRAILNFLRNAEDSPIDVRSVILDSNSPIGLDHQGKMSETYAFVLNQLLEDCAADPECNASFPRLKERFTQFLDSLNKDPLIVPLSSGEAFYFNKEELNATLHQVLYNPRFYKELPIFLEHMMARDENVLKLFLTRPEALVKKGFNALGAINFVYDHKYFQQSSSNLYRQNLAKNSSFEVLDGYMDFYMNDQRIETDSLERIPIKSEIPALFLASTHDPITPASWSRFAAQGFTNKFYFEGPRLGHGVGRTPCGGPLMQQFVNKPHQKPNNSCLEGLGENLIPFRTAYYKNSRIGVLLNRLQNLEGLSLFSVLFILLIALVNSIVLIVGLVRKRSFSGNSLKVSSALLFIGLIGMGVMVFRTLEEGPLLLLFGMVAEANYILFFVLISLVVMLYTTALWIRQGKRSFWNVLTAMSFVLFLILVVQYRLFPNV